MLRARAILYYKNPTITAHLFAASQHRYYSLPDMPSIVQMSTTAPSHSTDTKATETVRRCGAGGRELPELYKSAFNLLQRHVSNITEPILVIQVHWKRSSG